MYQKAAYLNSYWKISALAFQKVCRGVQIVKENHSTVMNGIISLVSKNLNYTSDEEMHKVADYWQTPDETAGVKYIILFPYQIETLKGDCEDGAFLIASLALQMKVPRERIRVICGEVSGGGHCCCCFNEYRTSFTFITVSAPANGKPVNGAGIQVLALAPSLTTLEKWYFCLPQC